MRSLLSCLFCVLLLMPAAAQEKSADTLRSDRSQSVAVSADDVQSLREDITRMKALIQQMQTNLAFVDTTQSPLKHQFQLEIDMWQTLITQMERRLAEKPHK